MQGSSRASASANASSDQGGHDRKSKRHDRHVPKERHRTAPSATDRHVPKERYRTAPSATHSSLFEATFSVS